MRKTWLWLSTALVATPAFAGISIGKPEPQPPPPKPPIEICVTLTNDGAAAERIHVSLYHEQVPAGGAMPSQRALETPLTPTQDVEVPPKRQIVRPTFTGEVPGTAQVCWKIKPIPKQSYRAVAGNELDRDGDVPVSTGVSEVATMPEPGAD